MVGAVLWGLMAAVVTVEDAAALHTSSKDPLCGSGMVSWVAFGGHLAKDECIHYCIPQACSNAMQVRPLNFAPLGIRDQGNCLAKGYTESSPYGGGVARIQGFIEENIGLCSAITFTKFRKSDADLEEEAAQVAPIKEKPKMTWNWPNARAFKKSAVGAQPAAEAPPAAALAAALASEDEATPAPAAAVSPEDAFKQPFCRSNFTDAFESKFPMPRGHCAVYCVPKGLCQQKMRTKGLSQKVNGTIEAVHISQRGSCEGFSAETPERPRDRDIASWFGALKGPCKGITYRRFMAPNLAAASTR